MNIEHGNLEVADSSLLIFTVVFNVCFFFYFLCFVYTFKELTDVHKCVCAVYGPNIGNELKVLNLY